MYEKGSRDVRHLLGCRCVFFFVSFHFTNYFFSTIQWFTSNTTSQPPLSRKCKMGSRRQAGSYSWVSFSPINFIQTTMINDDASLPPPARKGEVGVIFCLPFIFNRRKRPITKRRNIHSNTAARSQSNNGPRIIKTTLSLFFTISCFPFYKLIFLKSRSFLGINNDTLVSRTQTTDYFCPRYLSIRYILIFLIRF